MNASEACSRGGLLRLAFAAAALVSAACGTGWAQDSNTPRTPGQEPAAPRVSALPTHGVEHLFGDWGGVQTRLGNLGVELLSSYTSITAGNISGGRSQGVAYADQIVVEADIDWGKLAGLTGFSTHAVVLNRAGRNASADYIGDNLFQVQEVYGGGGNVLVHLVELYGEQSLLNGRIDVAAGRLPIGNDFARSNLFCTFATTAICGHPAAVTQNILFGQYPNSTWGGRVLGRPTARTFVQVGLFEVNPDSGGRSGFDWSASGATGVIVPVEIGYEPRFGPAGLSGQYKVGVMYDTSRYPDLFSDVRGGARAASGLPANRHRGRGTFYAFAEQMIQRNGSGAGDGLFLMAGYAHADPATSVLRDLAYAGLVDRGALRSRPKDSFGLLVAYAKVSDRLKATQEIETELEQPLARGAPGVQSRELILEAYYNVHVTDGLFVQPGLAYLIRPGASGRYPNAFVLDFKVHAEF